MKRFYGGARASFTLIEVLTVIAIIAILAGITLTAFSGVMKSAARSQSKSEIAAIANALESFKADNGSYPAAAFFPDTNYAADGSPATGSGLYQQSSAVLYQALSGMTNFGDMPVSGRATYMHFKTSELGNDTVNTQGNPIYIRDPYGYSYGYYTGPGNLTLTTVPNNGTNAYDLWTTGGDVSGVTNSWISNWGYGQ